VSVAVNAPVGPAVAAPVAAVVSAPVVPSDLCQRRFFAATRVGWTLSAQRQEIGHQANSAYELELEVWLEGLDLWSFCLNCLGSWASGRKVAACLGSWACGRKVAAGQAEAPVHRAVAGQMRVGCSELDHFAPAEIGL
jgi:hypothetical protein